MATGEEQYRKSLAQFGARLSQVEKRRLQFVYRLPSQYDELPPEAVLQALELMGMYSASRPEGVAELASWLGMSSLQKDIRKRLRKSKVALNDNFCLPFCDELYASVDLGSCIVALQRQTRTMQAHLELLKRVVTTQSRAMGIYECVGGPEALSEAAARVEQILHDLGQAATGYTSGKQFCYFKANNYYYFYS